MVEETVATVVGPQNMALQGMCYISQGTAFFFLVYVLLKWALGTALLRLMWKCVTGSPGYTHSMMDKNEEVRMSPPKIPRVTLNSQPPFLFHLSWRLYSAFSSQPSIWIFKTDLHVTLRNMSNFCSYHQILTKTSVKHQACVSSVGLVSFNLSAVVKHALLLASG